MYRGRPSGPRQLINGRPQGDPHTKLCDGQAVRHALIAGRCDDCGVLAELVLPFGLTARDRTVALRRAVPDDLSTLMRLLSDDPVSAGRGDVDDIDDEPLYGEALSRILTNESNDLVVAEDETERVVGTLQLTVIPGMARRGSTRLLVEAVRVASASRSAGIGSAMMRWVIDTAAPATGATLIQLTSDAARVDAHRFYQRLGFTDSHVGFKYKLSAELTSAR